MRRWARAARNARSVNLHTLRQLRNSARLMRAHIDRLIHTADERLALEIFARLNIKHGPNTEQIVRELPLHEEDIVVEFDLAYSNLNEKRVEKVWVDLIFEGPEMNQVILRDLTFSRRPRAAL